MAEFVEKYINPFTDYGFKKLFGEELNKDLLLDFLNELLKEEQGEIKDLTYLMNEHLGTTEVDRKVKSLLSNCKRPNRNSLKTARYIIPHFLFESKHNARIGFMN